MTELVRIHRDAKGTTRWLEPVVARIHAMSARFDGNADALVDDVYKKHAEKSPFLGLFVALDDDEIVGHLLAFVQQWDGRWVSWITQCESDRPVNRAFRDHTLAVVAEWVELFNFSFKNHGIHVDDMMDCTPHMSDGWARHSGFTPYRYIMIRKIPSAVRG